MKWWVVTGLLAVCFMVLRGGIVSADSAIKIQPVMIRETLKAGEVKKGHVDVSNPNQAAITVTLSVKAFRQIDDRGSLQFVDEPRIAEAIRLDVTEITLEPKDVLRLYFSVDSAKLPEGDVFASIMAATTPDQTKSTSVSAQAGALLVLVNRTPPSRTAEITGMDALSVQFGERVEANIRVKNTAPAGQATGFFPRIVYDMWPYERKELAGPLIFAGRTRDIAVVQPGSYAGLVRISAKTGQSEKTTYAFVVTGWYRWALPLGILGAVVLMYIALHLRKRLVDRTSDKQK